MKSNQTQRLPSPTHPPQPLILLFATHYDCNDQQSSIPSVTTSFRNPEPYLTTFVGANLHRYLQLAAPDGHDAAFKSTTFFLNEARKTNKLQGSQRPNVEYRLGAHKDGTRCSSHVYACSRDTNIYHMRQAIIHCSVLATAQITRAQALNVRHCMCEALNVRHCMLDTAQITRAHANDVNHVNEDACN